MTGNAVADELQRLILTPLRDTTLDAQARIAGPHARGYAVVGKPPARDVTVVSPTWAWTAGAMVSTVDDFVQFYRALFRGRLLRPPLLRLMERTFDTGHGLRYGLGVAKTRLPCGITWGHDGDFPG